jgi:hypothetical protein
MPMPMLRPLAALLAASTLAACAAGGHRVPGDDDRIDVAHRDSLVAGSAIPATMPFEGSVFPVPPSHQARGAGHAARTHQAAEPMPAGAAQGPEQDGATAVGDPPEAPGLPVVPGASAAPASPAAPVATPRQPLAPEPAPTPPAAPGQDEHAGHTP